MGTSSRAAGYWIVVLSLISFSQREQEYKVPLQYLKHTGAYLGSKLAILFCCD